jgi:hypothetical protein
MTSPAGHLPRSLGRAHGRVEPTRAADRAARRAFRSRRVWPALIGALVITVAGVLTAIEAISALAGDPARLVPYDRVTSWAVDTSWRNWAALLISAVLVLLGLLFLSAGLRPGRGRLIPLHGDQPDLIVGVTRRGLKGAVASAAESVDGVSDVRRLRLRRHKVKLVAATGMREQHDLRDRVKDAVRLRLDEIGPMPRRRVAVRIRTSKD